MYKRLVFSLGFIALLAGCETQDSSPADLISPPASAMRPNFLIITTDDMGYTDLGAFGGKDIPTPNLDSLAMQGVRLTNFHAAPVCSVTRSMLMTGTGNHEAGLGTQPMHPEFEGREGYESHLTDRVLTLPERLRATGYHTYMAGKWHLGDEEGVNHPGDRGFERSFALLPGGMDHYNPDYLDEMPYSEDGKRVRDLPDDFYSTTAYVDKMIGYLQSNQGDSQPFFAWFAPTAPHWPLQAAPGWKDKFAGKYDAGYDALCRARLQGAAEMEILPNGADTSKCPEIAEPWERLSEQDKALNRRALELYAALAAHMDSEFGRLLEYLRESGQLDNTYIIYHNDNGPQGGGIITARSNPPRYNNELANLGNRDSWIAVGQGDADATSAPFRGNKGSQYEGGIRTAAFIRAPNPTESGRISNSLVTVMDIAPTILDLAGVPEVRTNASGKAVLPIRGKSFATLLSNPAQPVHAGEYIALDMGGYSVLMHDDWKIVREPLAQNWSLFQTSNDPSETKDLAADNAQILADLVARYEDHASSTKILRRVPGNTGRAGGMGGMGGMGAP